MDESSQSGEPTKTIVVKVMTTGSREPDNISIDIPLSKTVLDLKTRLKDTVSTHPEHASQRLIYQGRQLTDDTVLTEAFRTSLAADTPISVHLVVRPDPQTVTASVPARNFFSSSSPANTSRANTPAVPNPVPTPTRTTAPGDQGAAQQANLGQLGAGYPGTGVPPHIQQLLAENQARAQQQAQLRAANGSLFGGAGLGGQGAVNPQSMLSSLLANAAANPGNPVINIRRQQAEITITTERIIQTPAGSWEQQREETRQTIPPEGGPAREVTTTVTTTPLVSETDAAGQSTGEDVTSNTSTAAPPSTSVSTTPTRTANHRIQRTVQTQTIRYTATGRSSRTSTPSANQSQNAHTTPHNVATPSSILGGTPQRSVSPPQQQYYLLQSPQGPHSILLAPAAPQPPPSILPSSFQPFQFGGAVPLPPTGASLAPSLLSAAAAASPHQPPTPGRPLTDLDQREADLHARIEEARQANLNRFAHLREQQQQLLQRQQRIEQEAFAQYQQARAQAPPQFPLGGIGVGVMAGPPGQQQVLIQRHFAVRIRVGNPVDMLWDFLDWFVGIGQPNAEPPNQARIEARLQNVVRSFWLAVRLCIAIYLFTGGRDTRRDTIIWVAAGLIFIWQSGILNAWFLPIVRYLNNVIPDPNRIPLVPPQQPAAQPADGAAADPAAPGAPAPAANAGPVPDPQALAQRLIQQQNDRHAGQFRGIINAVEGTVGVFLASLIPGLGERIGNARAAEQERQRQLFAAAVAAANPQANAEGAQVPPAGEDAQQQQVQQEPPPQQPLQPQVEEEPAPVFGL